MISDAYDGRYGDVEMPFETLEGIGDPFSAMKRDTLDDLIICESSRVHYINNVSLLLTYPVRLLEDEYEDWILRKFANRRTLRVECLSFASEGHQTHVLVTWNSVFQCRSRSILDYEGIRPLMRKIHNGNHLKRVRKYMTQCGEMI